MGVGGGIQKRSNNIKDRKIEIIQSSQQRGKNRLEKLSRTLDFWNHKKRCNICIIRVPEKKKKDGAEKLFKDIRIRNIPNLARYICLQIQEAQKAPNRMNPKEAMPRHIIINLCKTEGKEKFLKAAREKMT